MHSDEIITFGLIDLAMNSYHLKMVYMSKMPGLYEHCGVMNVLLQEKISTVHALLSKHKITVEMFASGWIISLFS